MKVDMLMPQMGESITEATVSRWLKKVGDSVKKDEIILEISTDKVDSEIPAPEAGVITEILFKEGDTVPVKEKIATIDTEASAALASTPAEKKPEPVETSAPKEAPAPPAEAKESAAGSSERFYSPLVKNLAQKHGIALRELDGIEGSGQGGRLTKQDFLHYVESRKQPASSAQAATPARTEPSRVVAATPKPAAPTSSDMPTSDYDSAGVRVEPFSGMRKAIAEHMVRSKATSPHVYSVQEVDMSAVSAWRNRYKSSFKKDEGFNLSFTPFFLEAAVKALQKFPHVNSSVEGQAVLVKKHINLGCAVALGTSGLIVPVIKHAEERNLVGIARSLNDLALRARNKQLLPDDVAGGTFTVTNPGVFGTIIGTPIINQPQVAILCLGKIEKRPVVINDMIAIREMCYLTLSYDHRIIDGSMGGQFLAFISEYLSGWDMKRELY